MLNRVTFSTVVVGILFMGQPAWATTYFADALLPGNDSNNGTSESTPFRTAGKCMKSAIIAGDTCLIKNGTYSNEGLIVLTHGGASGSPITIKNYPGHSPKISWSDITSTNSRIVFAPGSSVCSSSPPGYVVFEGLEIDGAYNGFKIDCAHNLTFRGNHIHNTWYPGILIPAGFNITIDRNRIHHTGDFTGAIDPVTGASHTHAVYVVGKGYIITNNVIYDSYLYGLHLAAKPLGISPAPNTDYSGFQGLVANNTIAYTVTRGGIGLWDSGGGLSNTNIENNLFYENSQNYGSSAQAIDYVSCGACVATIRNNIWYGTGNSAVFSTSSALNPPAGVSVTNTRNDNPLMVNAPTNLPATPDFRLTSGSGAIDHGVDLRSVGITTDFIGSPRPQGTTFDVGAHEFSSDTGSPSPPQGLQVR